MNRMREHGHTVVEMLLVAAIIMVLAAIAAPTLKAYSQEAHALGAGRLFKSQFRKARSIAITTNTQTAIRFAQAADGTYSYSLYRDENHNGVLSAEIRTGRDTLIGGPFPLNGGASDVRVGINPGVPEIPPERGILDTSDPVRFGRSNMLSFSPFGTATPGTFYVAGPFVQAAVRVNPATGRVRLMVYRGKWVER